MVLRGLVNRMSGAERSGISTGDAMPFRDSSCIMHAVWSSPSLILPPLAPSNYAGCHLRFGMRILSAFRLESLIYPNRWHVSC